MNKPVPSLREVMLMHNLTSPNNSGEAHQVPVIFHLKTTTVHYDFAILPNTGMYAGKQVSPIQYRNFNI